MSAGSGYSETEIVTPLSAQTVEFSGSGRSRTSMNMRFSVLSDIEAAGSGRSRLGFVATLEAISEPIPDGPERWDGPTYSFTGDGGR